MSEDLSEYCSSKLYVSGKDLDPQIVTERLQIEPDKVRNVTLGEGSSRENRGLWRKAIDKSKESWDVSAQLDYWCELLNQRREQLAALRASGLEFEIDCFISYGPVALIALSPELLANLASLKIELSLSFYDKMGKL